MKKFILATFTVLFGIFGSMAFASTGSTVSNISTVTVPQQAYANTADTRRDQPDIVLGKVSAKDGLYSVRCNGYRTFTIASVQANYMSSFLVQQNMPKRE